VRFRNVNIEIYDPWPGSILASGITDLTYTSTALTTGFNYEFYVIARNSVGLSEPSDTIT